jgi:D-serine deaminase-like pyridoxal phosphate-dependent protein
MRKIKGPTLLLDQGICKANIDKMLKSAVDHHVQLIPHFKTHQSSQVGEWFREAGVKAITVTSVKMAKYFAKYGWKNITIAFPVNVLEIEELNSLASQVDLKIFVSSVNTAELLKEQLKTPVKVYIEVDTGDCRSGVDAESFAEISKILKATENSKLQFFGFYSHPGHTYSASSSEEVKNISGEVVHKMRVLKRHFKEAYPEIKLALGDTPSCSIAEDFEDIDSIHPGNFVFYDLVQNSIGANRLEEIAICLAVPVVEVHPERNEVIVHSGWVHQGKDSLQTFDNDVHFGIVVKLEMDKWTAPLPEAKVIKLSQEHGVVHLPKDQIKQVKVGDVLGILPIHACATATMMGEIYTLKGDRLEMMPR